MSIWKRLEAWYSKKGISTNQFFDGYSTEMARDHMMNDFTERMLDKEEKTLKDPPMIKRLGEHLCDDCHQTGGYHHQDCKYNPF